jgi:ribosomal protein S4
MWNLRTFKLYNNDLWGTLLLSSTLTHPLKYLLKVRYKTRFHYRSVFDGRVKQRLKKVVRFKFFNTAFNSKKKGYYHIKPYSVSLDVVSSNFRSHKYVHLNYINRKLKFKNSRRYSFKKSYKLWRRVSVLFNNRYQFSRIQRRFNFKPTNKYLVDYTRPKNYDKLKARVKRRTFNSQRIVNFRKFKKFYATLSSTQFYKLVSAIRNSKNKGSLVFNFIARIESRVDLLLFRSGVVTSLFMAKHFISHSHVLINYKPVTSLQHYLAKFDLITLNEFVFDSLVNVIKFVYIRRWLTYVSRGAIKRNKKKLTLISFYLPSYIEVDYKSFSFILIADIFFKNVFYPFKISTHELEGFLNRVRIKL